MTTTAPHLVLHHVEMTTEDPPATAALLADAFGAVEDPPGMVSLGATSVRLQGGSAPRALSGLALHTDDIEGMRERLSTAQLQFQQEQDAAAMANPVLRLRADDWGGVPLVIGSWPVADKRADGSDGNVLRVDHVGVASADNAAAERRFCDVLGLRVESRQTDTETLLRVEQFTSDVYGVRVLTSQAGQSGLRVLFVSVGETDLELLQDLSSGGDGERSSSTAGDRSAIARYVERSGPGLHHLALRVRDIDAALARAHGAGAALLDREGRPGSRRARIAFLDPRSTARTLFHFVER